MEYITKRLADLVLSGMSLEDATKHIVENPVVLMANSLLFTVLPGKMVEIKTMASGQVLTTRPLPSDEEFILSQFAIEQWMHFLTMMELEKVREEHIVVHQMLDEVGIPRTWKGNDMLLWGRIQKYATLRILGITPQEALSLVVGVADDTSFKFLNMEPGETITLRQAFMHLVRASVDDKEGAVECIATTLLSSMREVVAQQPAKE